MVKFGSECLLQNQEFANERRKKPDHKKKTDLNYNQTAADGERLYFRLMFGR